MATDGRVVFRKWRNGDIIALMVDIPWDEYGHVTSYEHIGQHGAASYYLVQAHTTAAKPAEYADLMRELVSIGYDLKPVARWQR